MDLYLKLMKRKIKFSLVVFYIFYSIQGAESQTENKQENPFTFSASYIGDLVSNFNGGIKRGTTYLGLANLKAGFDMDKANWWKGGTVFVNIGNTHGGKPSEDLIGDFQGVSNIEAGNLTFMYELWYRQNVGKFSFTAGLQDLNATFASCINGGLFTNSSFGIQSSIADNIPTPIFPLTALGFNVQWQLSDNVGWQSAIFDGTPDDFENNPFNTKWTLSKNQGFLLVSELQFDKSLIAGRTGCYKLGVYYHQHNDTIDAVQKNGGIYFVGDQQLNDKVSIFSQIGLSPKKNKNDRYFSIGVKYSELFRKRTDDELGLAIAYAGIDENNVGSETVFELTYKMQINENIYIRPDIQYIMNPAGTDRKLENALVGFIRFGIDF